MARTDVARKRNVECRTKMRTGCATCRIRKVKCDEGKPFCQRCVTTGRTCDGYESTFRNFTIQPIKITHTGGIKSDGSVQTIQSPFAEIDPRDIDLLNRYFSTKTIFDVNLGCDEEARQVLQASLTDPLLRYAILSLRALRENFETSGDGTASVAQQTPSYHHGLQQYSMALQGLASKLSFPDPNGLKSALLCCQIFISIEQVRMDYAAMAQHIILGLRIMHEYGARPGFAAPSNLLPAYHDQLPYLDVFIIKLFAAPCRFAEPSAPADTSKPASPTCLLASQEQTSDSPDLRAVAPNVRAKLVRIAQLTLKFLSKVSQVKSVKIALQLLSEKAALLDSLEQWLVDLDRVRMETESHGPESISLSFLRIFHIILRMVLLGILDSSSDLAPKLRNENDQLQSAANKVSERLRGYTLNRASSTGNGKR